MLMMEEAHREGCQLAVFFLDLDNFKPVNDSLGHAAGDQLLQELSRRLEESRAPRELLYRFGGDEFLLVRTKLPREQEQWEDILQGRARQLLAAISEPVQIGQNTIVSTVSVGIAIAPLHSDNFAEISGWQIWRCMRPNSVAAMPTVSMMKNWDGPVLISFVCLNVPKRQLNSRNLSCGTSPRSVCKATG